MSSKDINLNSKNKVKHTVKSASQHTVENSWQVLRQYTVARIGLGRAGISVPTKHLLDFQLAHAQAQDAVHLPLDTENLITDIEAHCLSVHSQIQNRSHYLQRPDLGRRLNSESAALLKHAAAPEDSPYDLAIVIVDGLSSLAIQKNAAPLLHLLTQRLSEQSLLNDDGRIFSLAPIVIVQQGRVAIGDEVGELLNAKSVLVFIGERPGLSSPDSLGLYLTWAPKLGLTDESRNCISNIRLEGLVYREAVNKVIYLLTQAYQRKLTGVNLKDRSTDEINALVQDDKNFLLS
jgi:ethanolamine ammonia-lyase small subunit